MQGRSAVAKRHDATCQRGVLQLLRVLRLLRVANCGPMWRIAAVARSSLRGPAAGTPRLSESRALAVHVFKLSSSLTFSRFQVLTFSRFQVLTFSRFQVLALSRFQVLTLSRFQVLTLSRFQVLTGRGGPRRGTATP